MSSKNYNIPLNFLKSLNSTFIVLVAKVEGVNNIRQFKHISLMGCIYNLIYKVLARGLSRVIGEVIGKSQHVFIEGKQILDAVLVASEVVDEVVGRGENGVFCKLDMEKAYNHVCWEFVD